MAMPLHSMNVRVIICMYVRLSVHPCPVTSAVSLHPLPPCLHSADRTILCLTQSKFSLSKSKYSCALVGWGGEGRGGGGKGDGEGRGGERKGGEGAGKGEVGRVA